MDRIQTNARKREWLRKVRCYKRRWLNSESYQIDMNTKVTMTLDGDEWLIIRNALLKRRQYRATRSLREDALIEKLENLRPPEWKKGEQNASTWCTESRTNTSSGRIA